jgi:hypothetical protein
MGVYKENTRLLVDTFASLGKEVYGSASETPSTVATATPTPTEVRL